MSAVTFCARAGAWAAGLAPGDLPDRVAQRARLQVMSIAAARAAGEEAARPFARTAPDGPLGEVYAGAAALLLGPHNGQFWSSIHCASAAVAAGVGIGLDGERLGHTLAISLYQPPYGLWPGFMGPATKLATAAEPAVLGARAA